MGKMRDNGEYLVYDATDNDRLVYSGDVKGAATYLRVKPKAVRHKAGTPYEHQQGTYRIVVLREEESDTEDKRKEDNTYYVSESEIEDMKRKILNLNEAYLNLLTAERTLEQIQADIMRLRFDEVLKLVEWIKRDIREKLCAGDEEE